MDIEGFEKWNSYANLCFFSISLFLSLLYLIRFRFKVEKSSYIIMLSYLFTIGPRVLLTQNHLYSGIDIIFPILSAVTWGTLLFFTFEMAFVRLLITVNAPQQYKVSKRRMRIVFSVIYGIHFGIYTPLNVFVFIKAAD
jgi:hypothetical protein